MAARAFEDAHALDLARAGTRLRVGADGDATGRAIVDDLLRLAPGSLPWRMESEAYEEEQLADLLADLDVRAG